MQKKTLLHKHWVSTSTLTLVSLSLYHFIFQVSLEALDLGHFKAHLSSLWGSPNDVVHFLASALSWLSFIELLQVF